MCGIAGACVRPGSLAGERLGLIATTMADHLVQRGPDGRGRWVDGDAGVALAHTRLAILDLSPAGDQPMLSADGRWVVALNGEIYNHRQLARGLEGLGVRFRGHSDTEVLVEAVARWGVDATLDRIDGMFALALWDRSERQLSLARDRLGEKPLCWVELPGGGLAFGSTVDAVTAHPDVDIRIDRHALTAYLRHKAVPDPASIVEGVHKLPPAHLLTWRGGEPPRLCRYWTPPRSGRGAGVSPDVRSDAQLISDTTGLLNEAVADRLVADVGVGVFLSGGVDSTTVAAVAAAASDERVRTFTIAFDDVDLDESKRARAVADHLGTDHHELTATEGATLAMVERLGQAYDEPFGDSSALPTLLLAQLARSEVTVALTGDGGDEVFGGYNRYMALPAVWDRARRVPGRIRRPLARGVGRVPPRMWDRVGSLPAMGARVSQLGVKASKVAMVAEAVDADDAYRRVVSHWQDPSGLVLGDTEDPKEPLDGWEDSLVDAMIDRDLATYLPHDVLTKVDRATMSFGLESRAPLLARPVIEAVVPLPLRNKLRDGRGKWLLRSVLAPLVPSALWESPKQGFGPPLDTWMRGDLADWAEAHVFGPASRSHLDQRVLRRVWDEHQTGRRNHGYALWDVAAFGAWAEARNVSG
jgi:asparagine synthase (glutamine-hydrolysing)